MKKIILMSILTLSFNLFGEEKKEKTSLATDQTIKVIQTNYKSDLAGFSLGFGVGLGTGHFYAEDEDATMWLGADLLLGIASFCIISVNSEQDGVQLLKTLIPALWAAERLAQGVHAMKSVQRYNYKQQNPETKHDYSLLPIKNGAMVGYSYNF